MRYADRIFNVAIMDPDVNPLDADELEEYAYHKAQELCLRHPESVARKVRNKRPTVDDFKTAKEIRGEAQDLIG